MFGGKYKEQIASLETELAAGQAIQKALERSLAVIEFDPEGVVLAS